MNEPPVTDEMSRRKAFIADWLPKTIDALGGRPEVRNLEEMDLRNCPNAMYGRVSKALYDRLAVVSQEFAITPCAPLTGFSKKPSKLDEVPSE